MSRWKAAGIHLSISLLIATLAAFLVFGIWYPPPFTDAAGGEKLILVLLSVDLTIGPLLTLIVYRHGKPGMKFDLSAISLLQLGALIYGLSVVSGARPVFIVGALDRLTIVSADSLDDEDLAAAPDPAWRKRSWTGPILVAALLPTNTEERNKLVFGSVGGKDIDRIPKYYADYTEHAQSLLERAHSVQDATHPAVHAAVTQWVQSHDRSIEGTRWLPMVGRGGDFTAIVDAYDGRILDVLPVEPW